VKNLLQINSSLNSGTGQSSVLAMGADSRRESLENAMQSIDRLAA
jgi:hypothetical protein